MEYLQPGDLVGCRYRITQAQRHPNVPPTAYSTVRRGRLIQHQQAVMALLPQQPALGDRGPFLRIDLPDASADPEQGWLDTLNALAQSPTLISGATIEVQQPSALGDIWYVAVDILVRTPDGYIPVVVSNHRVARAHKTKQVWATATARLGLARWHQVQAKIKQHAHDSFTLALAARGLQRWDIPVAYGGLIGQDASQTYLVPIENLQRGLDAALATPVPQQALRIKECEHCRYQPWCQQELEERDDVSLFIRGQQAAKLQEQGIHTVADLITARQGELSQLALAWRENIPVLRRHPQPVQLGRDVEIDIDVEAYLDQGAYLWGTFDGARYRPFATWGELGGAQEAENFANFWQWLMQQRQAAKEAGQSFGVYCYSAHGENHWLRFSARRFAGKYPGVPSEQEVADFITSPDWIDVYAAVETQLLSPFGLGLKAVAHAAGFFWETAEIDGERAVEYFQLAQGDMQARADLLSYNRDDCRATAVVRDWLAQGTPGVPLLQEI